jgi:hypothetical protein
MPYFWMHSNHAAANTPIRPLVWAARARSTDGQAHALSSSAMHPGPCHNLPAAAVCNRGAAVPDDASTQGGAALCVLQLKGRGWLMFRAKQS